MRTLLILVIASLLSGTARAKAVNLAEVYQLAIQNDPQIGAAEAAYLARSEIVPQTRAGLLPVSCFQAAILRKTGLTRGS